MLTIESLYELANREALRAVEHPVCDREDLVQCAVIGVVEAGMPNEALAKVVARRRIIDELRRHRGRTRAGAASRRATVHDCVHLYQPTGADSNQCLADVLGTDDESLWQVENRVDAERAASEILREMAGPAGQVLVWRIVHEHSMAEIARHTGTTESQISELTAAALAQARARSREAHGATETGGGTGERTSDSTRHLDATEPEKRAFGEFRRLQRSGHSHRQALAMLPESSRVLVSEYQRKSQRRARARAAASALSLPTSSIRSGVETLVITPDEHEAVRLVRSLMDGGQPRDAALGQLSQAKRLLVTSYEAKMRLRARIRR